jgi:hypothetical protein
VSQNNITPDKAHTGNFSFKLSPNQTFARRVDINVGNLSNNDNELNPKDVVNKPTFRTPQ